MWKPETIILTVLFSTLAIVTGIMAYNDLFESSLTTTIFVHLIATIIVYTMLKIAYMRELMNQKDKDAEQNLDVCWTQVNSILSRMPGGVQLLWQKGTGRDFSSRVYADHSNQPHFFRAFIAFAQDTHIKQIIYYDATTKNIYDGKIMPEGKILMDLWSGFKPFDKQISYSGFGGTNKNMPNLELKFGSSPQPMNNYAMPNEQFVSDSMNNMNGGN